MLGLDGVDSGNATSPTAVPPHNLRINLHHSSQGSCSRAHADTGPTVGLLHAQAMEPETYHVGDMLGSHGASDGPGRGMAGGEGREQPRAGSAGCHRLRRRRAVRVTPTPGAGVLQFGATRASKPRQGKRMRTGILQEGARQAPETQSSSGSSGCSYSWCSGIAGSAKGLAAARGRKRSTNKLPELGARTRSP